VVSVEAEVVFMEGKVLIYASGLLPVKWEILHQLGYQFADNNVVVSFSSK
jgi:hypothetical protein